MEHADCIGWKLPGCIYRYGNHKDSERSSCEGNRRSRQRFFCCHFRALSGDQGSRSGGSAFHYRHRESCGMDKQRNSYMDGDSGNRNGCRYHSNCIHTGWHRYRRRYDRKLYRDEKRYLSVCGNRCKWQFRCCGSECNECGQRGTEADEPDCSGRPYQRHHHADRCYG